MSPFGDGAINGGCRCSCCSGDDGGLHNGATNCSFSASHDKTCTHCARSDTSCFPSALGFDSILLTDSKKLWRIFVPSTKGFSIGADLQGGLAIFSILTRLQRKKSRKVDKEAISMAIKETIRYGIFLGTFAGTFVSIDEIIATRGGHHRQCS
ncbi:hypothetical protein V6N13_018981 [Hibiscus sabdariffa]|uniref:Uncharacterized protein n=1 Tax=Hibiscus sabdariffa TaxID=183260 RepID=A0ABR2EK99_9ROSI